MSARLILCPFCAGEAHLLPNTATSWSVGCIQCGARGPVSYLPVHNGAGSIEDRLKAKAMAGWNARATGKAE